MGRNPGYRILVSTDHSLQITAEKKKEAKLQNPMGHDFWILKFGQY